MGALLSLPPVRRRLGERAQRALTQERSLLFVCLGNICRSPFAEAVARQHLPPDRRIASSGFWPQPGRSTPAAGIASAWGWDVDLNPHRSSVLDAAAVEQAGAVFVFDYENYRRLRREHPGARGRVHLLGALGRHGPLLVDDPYGGDERRFDVTYGQIAEAISAAWASPRPPTRS